MRKTASFLLAIFILLSMLTMPLNASSLANARWINTNNYVIAHDYYEGNAECCLSISGYSNAIVTNVDISFDQVTGAGLINIASWNDLSGGQNFVFYETVPNVEIDCIYRLTFTADVVKDGVVETITDYLERFYTITN